MGIQDVLTQEEFNTLDLTSYEQVCGVITKIVKLSVEESLKTLPQVMNHLTKQTAYIKDLSDEFYKKNPEFAKNKLLVAQIVEQAEAENPGMTYEQILEYVIPVAKRRLGGKTNDNISKGTKPTLDKLDNSLGTI